MESFETVLNNCRLRKEVRVAFVYRRLIKEPIGIGYLASYLREHCQNVIIRLFDPRVHSIKQIREFTPDLILYSIMSSQFLENIERNSRLKATLPPYIALFGGPHATLFPQMINESGVDIVCRGEGERPLRHLIDNISSGSTIFNIKGFHIKTKDTVIKNDVEQLYENLDDLPFPDRDLLYQDSKYFQSNVAKSIFTARGCPYRCSYCHNGSLNEIFKDKGRIYRHRSPHNVVQEIKVIKGRYKLPFILFGEDVFAGTQIEWLREFTERFSSIKIPYNISIRSENVTTEIAHFLKKSGCYSVSLAIEHGNYEYRKKYLCRHMTNESLIESIRMLISEGIKVTTPTIFGLPFTSVEDDLDTLRLVCKANPTTAGATIFQPYPGLPLTEVCLNSDLLEKNGIENIGKSCYSSTKIKGINYSKVNKAREYFGLLWMLNACFGIDVGKSYKMLPKLVVLKLLNYYLNYLRFKKIMKYRRGFVARLMELYVAFETGAYEGVKLFRSSWKEW